jgi:hypothetical protein
MGYFLLPLTLAADVLGAYFSYYYGASLLPWLSVVLPQFLWPALLWLISRPVWFWVDLSLPAPSPSPIPFFQHPVWPTVGAAWVRLLLLTHGYYAIKHLIWRYNNTHWGTPQAGNPGEQKWQLIQRRWQDYEEEARRFHQKVQIRFPSVRYTAETDAPLAEFRGRLLLIREDALHPSQVQELAPELAYQLATYNSHDWLFRDILDYYPKQTMLFHLLTGIGIWIPALINEYLWPTLHWRKRVFVADKFTWMLGQGQLQHNRLAALPTREDRTFFSPFPLLLERKGRLEALIRTEHQWMQDHHLIAKNIEPALQQKSMKQIPPKIVAPPDTYW